MISLLPAVHHCSEQQRMLADVDELVIPAKQTLWFLCLPGEGMMLKSVALGAMAVSPE